MAQVFLIPVDEIVFEPMPSSFRKTKETQRDTALRPLPSNKGTLIKEILENRLVVCSEHLSALTKIRNKPRHGSM
jgi:hypothetical protein